MNTRSFGDVFVVVSTREEISSIDDQLYLVRADAEAAATAHRKLASFLGMKRKAEVLSLENFLMEVRAAARDRALNDW